MAIDLAALKTELTTDPKALGYSAADPHGDAAKLNQAGLSAETIEPEFVDAMTVQAAVAVADYGALPSDAHRQFWAVLIAASASSGGFPIKDTGILAQLTALWSGAANGTGTRIAALQTRPAARAEVLFGENEMVSAPQVTDARGLI